jgi:hypothetical protein
VAGKQRGRLGGLNFHRLSATLATASVHLNHLHFGVIAARRSGVPVSVSITDQNLLLRTATLGPGRRCG